MQNVKKLPESQQGASQEHSHKSQNPDCEASHEFIHVLPTRKICVFRMSPLGRQNTFPSYGLNSVFWRALRCQFRIQTNKRG